MKQRILQFIDYKGINKNVFYKKTGLSNGFLDKSGSIGVDKLEKVLVTFPEINPAWLITGKGEMLLASENTLTGRPIVDQAQRIFDLEKIKFLQESVDLLKKTNELQEQISITLKEKLTICENEKKVLENYKSNV